MATKPLPSPEVLRQLLRYEPETGKLFWKERGPEWFKDTEHKTAEHQCKIWNSKFSGKEAFTAKMGCGYRHGHLLGALVLSHRVIFAMVHGDGNGEVDHINRVRDDNRICNLRRVNRTGNQRNRSIRHDNTSGFNGVSFNKLIGKWHSRIRHAGSELHLGYFESKDDAICARKDAEENIGTLAEISEE